MPSQNIYVAESDSHIWSDPRWRRAAFGPDERGKGDGNFHKVAWEPSPSTRIQCFCRLCDLLVLIHVGLVY